MLAKHSFGQANGAAWQCRVPSHVAGLADRLSAPARWHEREQKIEQAIAALAKLLAGLSPECSSPSISGEPCEWTS